MKKILFLVFLVSSSSRLFAQRVNLYLVYVPARAQADIDAAIQRGVMSSPEQPSLATNYELAGNATNYGLLSTTSDEGALVASGAIELLSYTDLSVKEGQLVGYVKVKDAPVDLNKNYTVGRST